MFTSDFIFGFCGETEDDHKMTMDLIDEVKYKFIYMFAYSMREKTHAHHNLVDDVPQEIKTQRVMEANLLFRKHSLKHNRSLIGTTQLVLVEGPSRRSPLDYAGRNDANVKVVFPHESVTCSDGTDSCVLPKAGDFVSVQITDATSQSLRAKCLNVTSLQEYSNQVINV